MRIGKESTGGRELRSLSRAGNRRVHAELFHRASTSGRGTRIKEQGRWIWGWEVTVSLLDVEENEIGEGEAER